MDPNNPGQNPGQATPPAWGPPPAPDQPGYGAPPPPPPAPYGAPPAPYGAPPAPYGAPPAPYGAPPAPAWGAPAPTSNKGGIGKRLIGIVIVVVVVIGIGAVASVLLPGNSGQVMFSKGSYAVGTNTCKFDSPVTEVTASDPIYMIARLRDDMQPTDQITLTVTKDGQAFFTNTIPAGKKFNCYIEDGAIGPLSAGVYKFTLSVGGKTEAEGTLTIK
ncbi:MAG: hypothetical protein ABSC46_05620 [Candidatus Limnocylindrales bacterium]|jgi:hypothetical protein